jgi:DNA-binding GntR family transcriptional regulator
MPIPVEKDTAVRTTARERVYKTLREWIVAGTLLPNERLNDVEIANYFSVSRTPVREALQMLSEQKLVTMVPSSGTFVAPIDPEDLVYVYDLLGTLQAHAVELGISRFTEDDFKEMRRINEAFYHHAKNCDPVESIKSDWAFHHKIAEVAGNPYLISFTEQLMLQAHRNESRFFKENVHSDRSYEAHSKIIEALAAGDAEEARTLIRQNWQVSVEGM